MMPMTVKWNSYHHHQRHAQRSGLSDQQDINHHQRGGKSQA